MELLFAWTPLELAANVMTAVCIFLAGRNSVHTWWTGIVATILFGILFFGAKLYADVTLQVFFLVTGIIGWIGWSNDDPYAKPLKVSVAPWKSTTIYAVLAASCAVGYGLLLHVFTDAYAPKIDSFVLMFSMLGQLLLMRRQIQTWPVWILVNTLAVPLFWSRELYMTSILYGMFWIHAWYAWWNWMQILKKIRDDE